MITDAAQDQAAQLVPSHRAPRTHGVDIQPVVDWAQSSVCSPRAFMRSNVYGESLEGLSDLMDDAVREPALSPRLTAASNCVASGECVGSIAQQQY